MAGGMDADKYADRKAIAVAVNRTGRCVKQRPDPAGRYVNPSLGRCELHLLPYWRWCKPASLLWEHGCAVSVTLLLRFLLEASLVCLLIQILHLPLLIDNLRRNEIRVACREWWVDNMSYTIFPEVRFRPRQRRQSADDKISFNPCACGYTCGMPEDGDQSMAPAAEPPGTPSGLGYPKPIRLGLPAISWYLWPTAGSCEEYTNTTTIIIPPPFYEVEYPFVSLPQAAFCRGPAASHPSRRARAA